MEKTMGLIATRDALGNRVDAAHFAGEATVITKNGQPRAVLVPYSWYRTTGAAGRGSGADVGRTSTDTHSERHRASHSESAPDQG